MDHFSLFWLAILLLTLAAVTVAGLLAAWMALGRGRWVARVAVAGGFLSLLLLVPAYEPLMVLVVQLLVAVPSLALVRRFQDRANGRSVWQFGLRDLLYLTAVVAAVMTIGVIIPKDVWHSWDRLQSLGDAMGMWYLCPEMGPWQYYLILGAAAGAATILAAWIALGRCQWWIRSLVLIVIYPIAIAALFWMFGRGFLGWPHGRGLSWIPFAGASGVEPSEWLFFSVLLAQVTTAVWLALFGASSCPRAVHAEQSAAVLRRRFFYWPARIACILLSLVLLAPLLWAYGVLMTTPSPLGTAVPDPNAYDQLIVLGRQLDKVAVPSNLARRQPSPQEFLNFERRYAELPASVHRSLALRSVVPCRHDPRVDASSFANSDAIKQLARAMVAFGLAARLRGVWPQSLQRYVDTMRLGRATAHGGSMFDWLVGFGVEGMARQAIHDELPHIPTDHRQALLATLENLDESFEPFETVRRREAVWTQNVYGWAGRLAHYLDELAGGTEGVENCRDAENRSWALFRLLLIELALENHCARRGEYPDRLDALVPDDLKELPLDPFTDRPLIYRRTATGYLLYSVGPNRQDDGGGTFNSAPVGDDDVRFE